MAGPHLSLIDLLVAQIQTLGIDGEHEVADARLCVLGSVLGGRGGLGFFGESGNKSVGEKVERKAEATVNLYGKTM